MNIKTARTTLNRAYTEFNAATDYEDFRQVAEKAWRAAREATYAVMVHVLGALPREEGTLTSAAVSAFESRRLGRDRGPPGSQPLAEGYGTACKRLYGECFYEGRSLFAPEDLQKELLGVECLIDQAEEDLRHAPKKKSRRNAKVCEVGEEEMLALIYND